MAERTVVTKDERVGHEGIFDLKEVMRVLKKSCEEKELDLTEKKHIETSTEKGKTVKIEFGIGKALTDYAKEELTCSLSASNLKNKIIEIQGKKRTMQTGTIEAKFDAVLRTDYENRWEMKPSFYFLRSLFEQFVYPSYLSRQKKKIQEDINHLKNSLKTYFNLQRYS